MSNTIQSPEDAKERRREQNRAAAARHAERLREMTPLERAAWKARKTLGDEFDPYTPEERDRMESLRALIAQTQQEAAQLNAQVAHRLRRETARQPEKMPLLAALGGADMRVDLKPH